MNSLPVRLQIGLLLSNKLDRRDLFWLCSRISTDGVDPANKTINIWVSLLGKTSFFLGRGLLISVFVGAELIGVCAV